jgi:hypothetical protein
MKKNELSDLLEQLQKKYTGKRVNRFKTILLWMHKLNLAPHDIQGSLYWKTLPLEFQKLIAYGTNGNFSALYTQLKEVIAGIRPQHPNSDGINPVRIHMAYFPALYGSRDPYDVNLTHIKVASTKNVKSGRRKIEYKNALQDLQRTRYALSDMQDGLLGGSELNTMYANLFAGYKEPSRLEKDILNLLPQSGRSELTDKVVHSLREKERKQMLYTALDQYYHR